MIEPERQTLAVRVWDVPVRIVHWAMVVLLVTSVVSAKMGGGAMDWHVRSGEAMLVLVLFRIVWGFFGSRHARFASFVRGPGVVIAYARSLLRPSHAEFVGHNPLGGWMVILLLLALLVQASLGLFSNDDIATDGPLVRYISKDLSDTISSFHKRNAWVVVTLATIHIGAALFYLVRFRENLITPMMIHGVKRVSLADAGASQSAASMGWALALFALCAFAVWLLVTWR